MLLAALALLTQSSEAQQASASDAGSRAAAALRIPAAVAELEERGVPLTELSRALEAFRANAVPATDAVTTLDIERAQAEPMEDFGRFVQQQLAAGKRGKDLAATIRDEHGRRKAERDARKNEEPL